VLGSRSTDTLANIGPKPLAVDDVIGVRPCVVGGLIGLSMPEPSLWPSTSQVVVLDLVLGPRIDWFTDASLDLLCSQDWQVTPQSNRVSVRLRGDLPLVRQLAGGSPSQGTAIGAIQVPPGGQPVVFLADHPLKRWGLRHHATSSIRCCDRLAAIDVRHAMAGAGA
jgi:allophanate hydrolase subunit 2